jgi:hypothetical protein
MAGLVTNQNAHSDLDMVSALFKWLVRMNSPFFVNADVFFPLQDV